MKVRKMQKKKKGKKRETRVICKRRNKGTLNLQLRFVYAFTRLRVYAYTVSYVKVE